MTGFGIGPQIGVETVDYLFCLDEVALKHFVEGGGLAFGAGAGIALVGNIGREYLTTVSFAPSHNNDSSSRSGKKGSAKSADKYRVKSSFDETTDDGGGNDTDTFSSASSYPSEDEATEDDDVYTNAGEETTDGTTSTFPHSTSFVQPPPAIPPPSLATVTSFAVASGAFIGVSLSGFSLSLRTSANTSLYKITEGRTPSPLQLLSGAVRVPREAHDLHSVLKRIDAIVKSKPILEVPEGMELSQWNSGGGSNEREASKSNLSSADNSNSNYSNNNKSRMGSSNGIGNGTTSAFTSGFTHNISFFSLPTSLPPSNEAANRLFETEFRLFLAGGVSVLRLLPGQFMDANTAAASNAARRTRTEHRTFILKLPTSGAMQVSE